MTKYAAIMMLTVCFCLPWGIATAGSTAEKKFYESCFSAKVERCLNKVRMIQSKTCCRQKYGEINLKKALYYHLHKEALLEEMMQRKLKMKHYKVDYFLIRAFGKEMKKQASLTR